MPREVHGYTIFCDDIREEAGGKFSIIGLYQGDLVLQRRLPAVLPKFGLFITLTEPATFPTRAGDLQVYIPGDSTEKPTYTAPFPRIPEESLPKSPKPEELRVTRVHFVIEALQIKQSGRIAVRLVYPDETIKLGSINILEKAAAAEA